MSAIATALRGKGPGASLSGPFRLLRRAEVICGKYGLTPARMTRSLDRFVGVLGEADCGATFPVTTATLARHPDVLARCQSRGIELAVHGFYHVDHTNLPLEAQMVQLDAARRVSLERGASAAGFRAPYLRSSAETIAAVCAAGFVYDSSQALAWDFTGDVERPAYQHVLSFYGADRADIYPSLPRLESGLVRIPYCLPDDEALADRLRMSPGKAMTEVWLAILGRTHELGELFTLGLHPERISLCEASLEETLSRARTMPMGVWIARLDEIARWWIARSASTVTVSTASSGDGWITADGPARVTILARDVEVLSPAVPWYGGWLRATDTSVRFRARVRPFVGVSRRSSDSLVAFLRQQGYVVEEATRYGEEAFYFDRPAFRREEERAVLAEIEDSDRPLIRLGRWPNGARSALCVTGDIDALTVGDYVLRLVER